MNEYTVNGVKMDVWKVIQAATREVGANAVEQVADKEQQAMFEAESKYELPDGFMFFRKNDWMGYSGASRFVNGVRPVLGQIRLVEQGKEPVEVEVCLSADDADPKRVLAGFHLGENGERAFFMKFVDLHQALANMDLLTGKTVRLSQLVQIGWSEEGD